MISSRHRSVARLATAVLATAALGLATAAPAAAHNDKQRTDKMRSEYSAGTNIPLLSSPNVNLVASKPGSAGISGCFTKTAPLFVSRLDQGLRRKRPARPGADRHDAEPAVRERGDELR